MPEQNGSDRVEQPDGPNTPDAIIAFGGVDPTDNRRLLEWQTRYSDPEARRWILIEAAYLFLMLLLFLSASTLLWLEYPKSWFRISDQKYQPIFKYALAWLGGMLGGTLFGIKWLYHTVARQLWNMDRRLWRFFTPHISAGIAFAMVAVVSSGLLRLFDRQAMQSPSMVMGLGFLVGYFSDSAAAKLAEIAETLFGTSRSAEKHKDRKSPSAPGRN